MNVLLGYELRGLLRSVAMRGFLSKKKKNERKIISYNNIEEDIDTTILFPLLKVFDTQRGLLN